MLKGRGGRSASSLRKIEEDVSQESSTAGRCTGRLAAARSRSRYSWKRLGHGRPIVAVMGTRFDGGHAGFAGGISQRHGWLPQRASKPSGRDRRRIRGSSGRIRVSRTRQSRCCSGIKEVWDGRGGFANKLGYDPCDGLRQGHFATGNDVRDRVQDGFQSRNCLARGRDDGFSKIAGRIIHSGAHRRNDVGNCVVRDHLVDDWNGGRKIVNCPGQAAHNRLQQSVRARRRR